MKKGTFRVAAGGQWRMVTGHTSEYWGVARSLGGDTYRWNITHLGIGFAAASAEKRADAVKFALMLDLAFNEWWSCTQLADAMEREDVHVNLTPGKVRLLGEMEAPLWRDMVEMAVERAQVTYKTDEYAYAVDEPDEPLAAPPTAASPDD